MSDPTPEALALLTQEQRRQAGDYRYDDELRELAQTKLERDQARESAKSVA